MTEDPSTVLVIDDDAPVRGALRDLFESVGLSVATFGSTREFLAEQRPSGPCCLVLDVRLPGKSGLDFQRELNEANMRFPIVFLTGHGDIPMSVRAMKAGAVEFLTKPFHERIFWMRSSGHWSRIPRTGRRTSLWRRCASVSTGSRRGSGA